MPAFPPDGFHFLQEAGARLSAESEDGERRVCSDPRGWPLLVVIGEKGASQTPFSSGTLGSDRQGVGLAASHPFLPSEWAPL